MYRNERILPLGGLFAAPFVGGLLGGFVGGAISRPGFYNRPYYPPYPPMPCCPPYPPFYGPHRPPYGFY
ncbi:hypothetical protein QYG89_12750 [Bacillus sp. B190/17]|uniref:Uroporphyrin-III methyltransferase n=1 Tax=Bacillus lumedeiriae TaxID=3058829 RepID=A0ABW8IBI7_9BACI